MAVSGQQENEDKKVAIAPTPVKEKIKWWEVVAGKARKTIRKGNITPKRRATGKLMGKSAERGSPAGKGSPPGQFEI